MENRGWLFTVLLGNSLGLHHFVFTERQCYQDGASRQACPTLFLFCFGSLLVLARGLRFSATLFRIPLSAGRRLPPLDPTLLLRFICRLTERGSKEKRFTQ